MVDYFMMFMYCILNPEVLGVQIVVKIYNPSKTIDPSIYMTQNVIIL